MIVKNKDLFLHRIIKSHVNCTEFLTNQNYVHLNPKVDSVFLSEVFEFIILAGR